MSDDDTPTRRAVRAIPTREHVERAVRNTDARHQNSVRDATEADRAPARRWEPKR